MLSQLTRHLNRLLKPRAPSPRQRPLAEQMEPRLLYSADLSPAALFSGAAMPAAETRTLDAPTADWLASEATQDQSRERNESGRLSSNVPAARISPPNRTGAAAI